MYGQLANDVPHGLGAYYTKDSTYIGQWVDSSFSGFGVISTDLTDIAGEWINDQLNGKEIWNITNDNGLGSLFVGEWKDGRRDGQVAE